MNKASVGHFAVSDMFFCPVNRSVATINQLCDSTRPSFPAGIQMPQPLRSKLQKRFVGTPYFLDALIEKRPAIAERVGICIARAANCELQMFRLYLSLHRTQADVAYASFTAIGGRRNRVNVMDAVASAVLSKAADLDLYKATVSMCTAALNQRDKLAHWIWGYTEALPDDALLADPKILLRNSALTITAAEEGVGRKLTDDIADNILVYTQADLDRLSEEIVNADVQVDLFRSYFHAENPARADQIREMILSNPIAQEKVEHFRSRRGATG